MTAVLLAQSSSHAAFTKTPAKDSLVIPSNTPNFSPRSPDHLTGLFSPSNIGGLTSVQAEFIAFQTSASTALCPNLRAYAAVPEEPPERELKLAERVTSSKSRHDDQLLDSMPLHRSDDVPCGPAHELAWRDELGEGTARCDRRRQRDNHGVHPASGGKRGVEILGLQWQAFGCGNPVSGARRSGLRKRYYVATTLERVGGD